MKELSEYMNEFRRQLEKGAIQRAYRGLMDYMMDLRTHFKRQHADLPVSGSVYTGYMDMTYFACFPASLKRRKLKIAIVFVYDRFRFEVWLAAFNRDVQARYWKLFRESGWDQYRIAPSTKGIDSIVEHTLADNPDFSDLDALTRQIERGTLRFIRDVERFLSTQPSRPLGNGEHAD